MGPIVDSLIFMRTATRTRDDKDLQNLYKRFPSWPCFDVLHDYFLQEPALFVEKSRTMLCTWWATGECLHHVMVNQPASCIFWCPDMDRAQRCMDYCWVWHEQMDERLKAVFPLDRPKERQAKYRMELRGGGWLEALPGHNPDKIRSQHPTIVMMDEAANSTARVRCEFSRAASRQSANSSASATRKVSQSGRPMKSR